MGKNTYKTCSKIMSRANSVCITEFRRMQNLEEDIIGIGFYQKIVMTLKTA